jgi:hypothetical protein
MRLSVHQQISLVWMIAAPGIFAPVLENAKRPDAGVVMAWGVAIVATMILFSPLLLRWSPFRGWTDALSKRQHTAFAQRDIRGYYETAVVDDYATRVVPYLRRITWTASCLMAATSVMPHNTSHPALDALVVFSTWYPLGVLCLALTSLPLGHLLTRRL